jgi:MFS family permease
MKEFSKAQSIALVIAGGAASTCATSLGFPYLNWAAVTQAFPEFPQLARLIGGFDFLLPLAGALGLGWIADLKGLKYAICLALLLEGLAAAGLYFAPLQASSSVSALALMVVLHVAQTFAGGGGAACMAVYLLNLASSGFRARFVSLQPLSGSIGSLCAGLISYAFARSTAYTFADSQGWRLALLATGILAVVLSAISTRLAGNADKRDEAVGVPLRLLLRAVITGWVIFTTIELASALIATFSRSLQQGGGAPVMYWPLSPLALGLVGVAGGGWISDKFGRKLAMTIGASLLVPILFLQPFFWNALPAGAPSISMATASIVRMALEVAASTAVIEALPQNLRARGLALTMAAAFVTRILVLGPGGGTLLNGDLLLCIFVCLAAVWATREFQSAPFGEGSDDALATEPPSS